MSFKKYRKEEQPVYSIKLTDRSKEITTDNKF